LQIRSPTYWMQQTGALRVACILLQMHMSIRITSRCGWRSRIAFYTNWVTAFSPGKIRGKSWLCCRPACTTPLCARCWLPARDSSGNHYIKFSGFDSLINLYFLCYARPPITIFFRTDLPQQPARPESRHSRPYCAIHDDDTAGHKPARISQSPSLGRKGFRVKARSGLITVRNRQHQVRARRENSEVTMAGHTTICNSSLPMQRRQFLHSREQARRSLLKPHPYGNASKTASAKSAGVNEPNGGKRCIRRDNQGQLKQSDDLETPGEDVYAK